MSQFPDAKQQVEQLMGRLDAVKGEISSAQHEVKKFSSQGMQVETREVEADLQRLLARKKLIELELQKLKKFW